ncbi:GNAT family N-acetyltransferase [Xenorhabdus khoisanae]|uniref:GNAT family N-acetyltransferase n=1 Tax=Xenorhabdus khoisanae TaxID=880157 RepID=UPI002358E3DF|nr:GNAT family N-acetyltransferase [Xenorhabdus khoisanae]MDC9616275.1 GNAT family N-acetyltransferase [Xenorhabdus khoisanae]
MLKFRRIDSHQDHFFDLINELYNTAFPLHEQRSNQGRLSILGVDHYYLYALIDVDVFIGFIGAWKFEDFFYIEHIAISSSLRGQGYGKRVLDAFCTKHCKVVLEIDPVVDEISSKRLRFYQQCGFVTHEILHHHPSYHPDREPHELVILSYPEQLSELSYQAFKDCLIHQVMKSAYL